MAEQKKKTQAQKAASSSKGKSPKAGGGKSADTKNNQSSGKKAENQPTEQKIPVRLISSALILGLFILFLVTFLKPEGALVNWLAISFMVWWEKSVLLYLFRHCCTYSMCMLSVVPGLSVCGPSV